MSLRNFRYVALAEATTFLVLLVASFVKRTGGGELGVQVLGPIHGLLFIAYVALALGLREEAGWTGRQTFWILVGAVLPFGGYVVDRWLSRRERRNPVAERAIDGGAAGR
jgi:integral membrane protein